ncbi:MAG TPA: alpha/beta fold hydrolase [Longimicrobiaceae bacterium]
MTKRSRILLLAGAAAVFSSTTAAAFVSCTPEAVCAADAERGEKRELVVLLHGLGRTRLSMAPLAWALERQGYDVLNWGYSSTSASIPELGTALSDRLASLEGPPPERVHFVGHSLGNVIVRWVLANRPPENVGRVVMLAPPNQGSRAADRYAPWLGWLLRPLPELRTRDGSTVRTLALPEGVEVAVIAGRYDGKVSVEESHLDGEKAHLVVPAAHTFLMNRADVRSLTLRFLGTGSFAPAR